jgi:hypothetical protein
MRKFAQPIDNNGKFKYILGIIKQYTPNASHLFHEILANVFVYETQGIPLDKIVKQPGDYKTKFGITSPFLKDLVTRGISDRPGVPPQLKGLANLNTKEQKMLELVKEKSLLKGQYDPGGLDLETAILSAYFGVWKKMSLDSLVRYPNVVRILFDFAFNAGVEKATKYFKIALNRKAQEIVNELNKNIKDKVRQAVHQHSISLLSQLVKSVNLPKNQIIWNKDNTITYKPLAVNGSIDKDDGTTQLISYIINTGIVTEPEMAMALNNLRISFHKTKSPGKFREGLLNRVRSYNEMLSSQLKKDEALKKAIEEWRSSPKNKTFHQYITQGKGN